MHSSEGIDEQEPGARPKLATDEQHAVSLNPLVSLQSRACGAAGAPGPPAPRAGRRGARRSTRRLGDQEASRLGVAAPVLHRDRDQCDRHAPGDHAAKDLRDAEADDEAEDGAAGDDLRRVALRERFRIEVRAQMLIELVDAVAHAVARAHDRPFDRLLFLIFLGHHLLPAARATSAFSVSMSCLMCAIDSFGTKFTFSSFFFPIIARKPAAAKSTIVTISADSHAGTPRATRPRAMVTKRKAMPISAHVSAPAMRPAPVPNFFAASVSSNLRSAISLRNSIERSAVSSLKMVPSERSESVYVVITALPTARGLPQSRVTHRSK